MRHRDIGPRQYTSLLFAAALLAARPAAAESEAAPEPPPAGVMEQMQQRDEQATRYFQERRYDLALREWQAAHELGHHPIFLFNMAQCHRRAGRYREALALFQRYVELDPKSDLKLETLDKIHDLRILLDKQEQIERERRRPLWKKGWFWGVMTSTVAVAGAGLALGLSFGLRDNRDVIEPTF
jgi:tetratricopeptide (TPR) repeat protein